MSRLTVHEHDVRTFEPMLVKNSSDVWAALGRFSLSLSLSLSVKGSAHEASVRPAD
ncbi:hypothetical protein OG543_23890 [Streptomyces sp. NBC_01178]|uniref:hypothetical protein n=1 Tax=Streptomyces sp. NBC_01178 TaxID=2903762 RepID=UPI0038661EFC|nr:hypothetical protein OG543_23890 [Streptomyces sp. NBC_01178]